MQRAASRLQQPIRRCLHHTPRRTMSDHIESEKYRPIPGPGQPNLWISIPRALAVGLVLGLGWKWWQWGDKARQIEANAKWEEYLPIYLAQEKEKQEKFEADGGIGPYHLAGRPEQTKNLIKV